MKIRAMTYIANPQVVIVGGLLNSRVDGISLKNPAVVGMNTDENGNNTIHLYEFLPAPLLKDPFGKVVFPTDGLIDFEVSEEVKEMWKEFDAIEERLSPSGPVALND